MRCSSDADCGGSDVCRIPVNSTTYQCVSPTSPYRCVSDSDCDVNDVCRIPVGSTVLQCVPDTSQYQGTSNKDCVDPRSCINWICM